MNPYIGVISLATLFVTGLVIAQAKQFEQLNPELMTQYEIALKLNGRFSQTSMLRNLVYSSIEQKEFYTGFKIAESIKGASTKRSTLSDLAIATAMSHDIDLATTIAESIVGDFTRDKTLKKIIKVSNID